MGTQGQTSDLERGERTRLGAWYTPPAIVEHVLDHTLDPLLIQRRPMTIIDPACGDGNFLVGARQRLIGHGFCVLDAERCLIGIDVSDAAISAAQARLPGARLLRADGLTWEPDVPIHAVVGNPPFLSQLRSRTARTIPGRRYADAATLFFERWALLMAPGGRLGFVMPLSMLATSDARSIRDKVLERCSLQHIHAHQRREFDAAVYTMVVVVASEGPDQSGLRSRATWSHLVAAQFGIEVDAAPHSGATLATIATATADFRDQYYGLVGAVSDEADGPPLITSGLIGPGVCHWGARPVRFAKRRFDAPRVDLGQLNLPLQRWAARRLVPKVLVATQSRQIHAVIDRTGQWLPSVPVITVVPNDPADLDRVASALLDPSTTKWARSTFLGAALAPTAIKLSAKQVLQIPLGG